MAVSDATLTEVSPASRNSFERGYVRVTSFTLPTSINNGVRIPFGAFSGGEIIVDGAGGGTITWYACDTPGGTPYAALNKSGAPITTNIAAGAGGYEIPSSLFGRAFLFTVVNSGTVAARLVLKR